MAGRVTMPAVPCEDVGLSHIVATGIPRSRRGLVVVLFFIRITGTSITR